MNIHDQDTFRRGKQQGIQEKAIETAKKFLAMGLTFKQVAEGTDLPLETVEEIAKSKASTQTTC
jgi:predicted transposase/invertase (TIGR01784 family)